MGLDSRSKSKVELVPHSRKTPSHKSGRFTPTVVVVKETFRQHTRLPPVNRVPTGTPHPTRRQVGHLLICAEVQYPTGPDGVSLFSLGGWEYY